MGNMKNNNNKNHHIAMWVVPRSRSTAITRAFEQLEECVIYDEPLYGAYFVNVNADYHLLEERILKIWQDNLSKYPETNYDKIIQKATGKLPDGKSISFQKNMSYFMLPKFGRNWLKSMKNLFLIRDPKETIVSSWKNYRLVNQEWRLIFYGVGWEQHYSLFRDIEALTGSMPLVIDSTDLVKKPREYLEALCFELGIDFSEKMLNWSSNPDNSNLNWGNTVYASYYENILNSTGFFYEDKKSAIPEEFPNELRPYINSSLAFYEEMSKYRMILE